MSPPQIPSSFVNRRSPSFFGGSSSAAQFTPNVNGQLIAVMQPISGMAAAALALSIIALLGFFWVYFSPLIRQVARRRRRANNKASLAKYTSKNLISPPGLSEKYLPGPAGPPAVSFAPAPLPPPRVALHPPSPEPGHVYMPMTRDSSNHDSERTLTPPQPAYFKHGPPAPAASSQDLEAQRPVPF